MATNFARASYSEIYDFGTKSNNTTVIGIHTPSVETAQVNPKSPRTMLAGFFQQFRKFRYAGARVTLVPAAQLPADPLQVSFEAGQPTIDPRDLLNPILFHGTSGESLNIALNHIFADAGHDFSTASTDTDDIVTSASLIGMEYYSALSDNTWRKFGVQQPARLPYLYPLVHVAATTQPIAPPYGPMRSYSVLLSLSDQLKAAGQPGLDPLVLHDGLFFNPPLEGSGAKGAGTGVDYFTNQFVTSSKTRLGWLPTTVPSDTGGTAQPRFTDPQLPKIFMGVLMFPPSYTQELYFRMTIEHFFEFKDFQGVSLGRLAPQSVYYQDLPSGTRSSSLTVATLEDPSTETELIPTTVGVA